MASTTTGPITPEKLLTAGTDMVRAGEILATVARSVAKNGWPHLEVGYVAVFEDTVAKLIRFAESADKSLRDAKLAEELASLPKNVGMAPKETGNDGNERRTKPRSKTSK